jgi:hypothetical protein
MPLSPLAIPKHRTKIPVMHDLNTRLGRAYERLCAFVEEESPRASEEAVREIVAVTMKRDAIRDAEIMRQCYQNTEIESPAYLAKLAQAEAELVAANQRLEDVRDVTRALNRELREAKREAGECVPPTVFKSNKTLEEWDLEFSA